MHLFNEYLLIAHYLLFFSWQVNKMMDQIDKSLPFILIKKRANVE